MKKKKLIFIIIGAFVICFIIASIFFVQRALSAADKRQEYFDVYRADAEEYIKSEAEMLDKYGDDISVEFDNLVTYEESGDKGLLDIYIDMLRNIFAPRAPESIEEFNEEIESIQFSVKVNGNAYEITFEKNELGELVVSELIQVEK